MDVHGLPITERHLLESMFQKSTSHWPYYGVNEPINNLWYTMGSVRTLLALSCMNLWKTTEKC